MSKLCQIVAVEKGIKSKVHQGLTDAYQKLQKPAILSGISRTYRSKDDEGEVFPPEQTKVQLDASVTLQNVSKLLTELFDITLTKDVANCGAKSDIVVGDILIAKDVPVTYLLFLEKKLVDIHAFISKLPTLDVSENWRLDPTAGCYASDPTETHRTKKIPKVLTKAAATDKHPAQVEVFQEDVVVGYWKTIKFSGALPASTVATMLDRVEKLQRAVKFAREECNSIAVENAKIGEKVFSYLLG